MKEAGRQRETGNRYQALFGGMAAVGCVYLLLGNSFLL